MVTSRAILVRAIPVEIYEKALARATAEGETGGLPALLLSLLERYALGRAKMARSGTAGASEGLTAEERTARAKKAAEARWGNATPEERIAQGQTANAGRQAWLTRRGKVRERKRRARVRKKAKANATPKPPGTLADVIREQLEALEALAKSKGAGTP